MPDGLRALIISVVTCVWAANFTAPIFVTGYTPSPELNVAFMAIIGIVTAVPSKKDPPDDGAGTP